MTNTISVTTKSRFQDPLGKNTLRQIENDLGISGIDSVKTSRVYKIDGLSPDELHELGQELFSDPIINDFEVNGTPSNGWRLEVGLKPGVKDNEGEVASRAIKMWLGKEASVYTSRVFELTGDLYGEELERIASELLSNEIVEDYRIVRPGEDFEYLSPPEVTLKHEPEVSYVSLDVTDEELVELSRKNSYALNLEEMRAIREYFKREDVIRERLELGLKIEPTDAELEVLAQTWSEHCKHKIFNAKVTYIDEYEKAAVIDSLFNTYIKASTKQLQQELHWVKSTLWDNAGVVQINDKWLIATKCETHNSPSQKEPVGGSITGIGGVYRDPMGTGRGGEIISGQYGFYNGTFDYDGDLVPNLHPKRLLNGEVLGVEQGGNKFGAPTDIGDVFFDDGYLGKTAVFVQAIARIPVEVNGEPGYEKSIEIGDEIVMVGGRVGIDGIHGATESSMEAGEHITLGHVQMGDLYTQKKMHDFLLEARDLGLYKFIQDNGAGGLSSSVGESGTFSGGFKMDLKKVPLKYQGLDPWQILVSESQERMTLAVNPENIEKFKSLAEKHGVESSDLGKFTDSGKYHVVYGDQQVAYMDMDFVHNGVPQMELNAKWITPEERGLHEPELTEITDHGNVLRSMLARPNIASTEFITRRYDHEVGGTSVVKHLVGAESDSRSDAAVQRIDLEGIDGLAKGIGSHPYYNEIDSYHGTAAAIDEAIRRVVAVGGDPNFVFLNDNFCWPSPLPSDDNPDAEYKMAQLVRANQALHDYTLGFKAPCVSGKDSMSMDGTLMDKEGKKHRISALPTARFSSASKVPDVNQAVTMDVKNEGDLVYVLGVTKNELGGSEFYKMSGETGLNVPQVDLESSTKLYSSLHEAMKKGLVKSCHGCYRGGLGVALAETAFAGGYGLSIDLTKVSTDEKLDDSKLLYSESAGRYVVTVSLEYASEFEETVQGSYRSVGYVRGDKLSVYGRAGSSIINENINDLKQSWKSTFEEL